MNLSYRNERNAKFISAYYGIPLDKPDWYKIEATSDDEADILLYSYIGWPFNDEREFIQALDSLKQKNITVRINSQGGDVWAANAIHNAIKAHPSKPATRIESLAASAASYIAVAGHKKQAYKNTMGMIHEPMVGFYGNQYEIDEVKSILMQVSDIMVDMYADNTNVGKRELKEMLKTETWMNAKTLKEKGFIDTIIEAGKPIKAEFDLSIFNYLPDELKSEAMPKKITEREIERGIRDVFGLSESKAKAVIAGCRKAEDTDTPVVADESKEFEAVAAELRKSFSILSA